MKIINKDDNKHIDGSGSKNDKALRNYGDNYDDSYSNHEISDDKDDNDDDDSDSNDQIMNAQIALHIDGEDF